MDCSWLHLLAPHCQGVGPRGLWQKAHAHSSGLWLQTDLSESVTYPGEQPDPGPDPPPVHSKGCEGLSHGLSLADRGQHDPDHDHGPEATLPHHPGSGLARFSSSAMNREPLRPTGADGP